jgi:hypothetical protein
MVLSFQKDRRCQCRDGLEGPSLGHRRLRFSFQINDFKDPEPVSRSHRLAPGCGGGGDVVASVFRVKRYFRRSFAFHRRCSGADPGAAGAASLERTDPCVNQIFRTFLTVRTGVLQAAKEVVTGSGCFPPDTSSIRQERGDYCRCAGKARGRSFCFFAGVPVNRSPRGRPAPPVAERGGDIRGGSGVYKRLFRVFPTFSSSAGRPSPCAEHGPTFAWPSRRSDGGFTPPRYSCAGWPPPRPPRRSGI